MTESQRVSQIWLNKIYWLEHVAATNPFATSHFLWLDVGRLLSVTYR